jgi:hypothetical protein
MITFWPRFHFTNFMVLSHRCLGKLGVFAGTGGTIFISTADRVKWGQLSVTICTVKSSTFGVFDGGKNDICSDLKLVDEALHAVNHRIGVEGLVVKLDSGRSFTSQVLASTSFGSAAARPAISLPSGVRAMSVS